MDTQESKLEQAYQEYVKRQSRESHPDGTFDRGGRWYPSEAEEQSCCGRIRNPSRAYPYSLLTHCRSMAHVARLFGVKAGDLRKLHQARTIPAREGGDDYYKVVAVDVDGRLFSIYDGETEYQIGVELSEAARQHHKGGFYCYDSPEAARRAPFPKSAELLENARVLLRVRAEGSYCRYENGKLAFSRITPLEIMDEESVV